MIRQVRDGSSDPWAYLGLAICGSDVTEARGEVLENLDALPQDSPLVLFARGHMSYSSHDLEDAETSLRRATQQQEDFALAWNTLAVTVLDRGDARSALAFVERALDLSPNLLQTIPIRQKAMFFLDGADRLLQLLGELPQLWVDLSEPVIPISGRSIAEVLETSSEQERQRALQFISDLFQQPLDQRADWIGYRLDDGPVAEVDLWIPFALAEDQEAKSPNESMMIYEAALQWAAGLSRRDVLGYGAAMAFDGLDGRVNANDLRTALGIWADLPRMPGTEHGLAKIRALYGRSLSRDGQYPKALMKYREARGVLGRLGDTTGQAQTWTGEAGVLARQGKTSEALEAYGEARRLFRAASQPTGWAQTWVGVGGVHYRQGKLEKALSAYRKARSIFESSGDQAGWGRATAGMAEVYLQLGQEEWALTEYQETSARFRAMNQPLNQGSARIAEADVLLQLSRDREALTAYREARRLLEEVGDVIGQANSWDGEGDVLLLQGDLDGSLRAYQVARRLYQKANDLLGEGNSWKGEADVLFQLAEYDKAAATAAQAVGIFRRVDAAPNLLNALIRESEARFHDSTNARALTLAEEATELFGQWRQGYLAEEHRTDVDADIARAYDLLVFLLSRDEDQIEDALGRAEESRSRVLLDLLTAGGIGAAETAPDLVEEQRRLLADLAKVGEALSRNPFHKLRHELRTRQEALDAALQRNLYQRIAQNGGEQVFGDPVSAPGIHRIADEVGPVVLYHGLEAELLAFLILPSSVSLHRIDLPRDDLSDSLENLLFDLSNKLREDHSALRAEQLWQTLIAPFANLLPPSGPLTILPHGPLHSLPFEVLVDCPMSTTFVRDDN